MKYSQRPKYERRNETIAVLVMILLCIPVLFIYFSFFANAFILDSTGELTLQNFQFLYQPIQLSQYTVEPIGKAFRNTVIFTAIATTLEVTISCMAGYALARMEFTGKRVISFSLLTLRLFPGVLLLIGVLYVLGMFMETLATIIILVPVLLPMILQLGIDPIHFGIVLVVTNNVAMLTPPLGVNLFVASRIAGISVERISVAVIPYLIALTLCILLFTYVPAISTWLPSLMGYGQ